MEGKDCLKVIDGEQYILLSAVQRVVRQLTLKFHLGQAIMPGACATQLKSLFSTRASVEAFTGESCGFLNSSTITRWKNEERASEREHRAEGGAENGNE